MALTLKQKERLNRQIGVLDGMRLVLDMCEDHRPLAEKLADVVTELQKVLDEDGGAEG